MKFVIFALLLLAGSAHAAEFRLKAWKKPPSWKCGRESQGALICRSPYSGEDAKMTMRLKPASPGVSYASLKSKAVKGAVFERDRTLFGRPWIDALYQTGSGPVTRSSQTIVMADGKRQIFEVVFEASEDSYKDIEKIVNRTIMSVKIQ